MHFSGFCFDGEEELFFRLSKKCLYDVSGFSYGAQKACEEVFERVKRGERVQKLLLYSPAFFEDKTQTYKNLQISYFKKNKQIYIQNFLQKIGVDEEIKKYFKEGAIEDLQALLSYRWDEKKLAFIQEKGVLIEVYLGECDEIINAQIARDFFSSSALVYFIKGANHCLR